MQSKKIYHMSWISKIDLSTTVQCSLSHMNFQIFGDAPIVDRGLTNFWHCIKVDGLKNFQRVEVVILETKTS